MTTIRRAAHADFTAIRELVRAAYAQYEPALPAAVYRAYLADLLDLCAHEDHGTLYVAIRDDRIVGSAAFYADTSVQGVGFPSGWAGGRGLAVHPDARSVGVAAAMLSWFEERAGVMGAPVFAFHAAAFMTTAAALYGRLGYVRMPQYDFDLGRYFGITGLGVLPAIAYGRRLVHEQAG